MMHRWLRSAPWLSSVLCLAALPLMGCGDDSSDAGTPLDPPGAGPTEGLKLLASDCDNIAPTQCGYPFPSNVYLDDDPTGKLPSGKRLTFGATTLPKTQGLRPVDPSIFHDKDGFSVGSGVLAHLPGATSTGMATPNSIERSLEEDHPSVLIEADTGRRVPHWVDLDYSAKRDGTDDTDDERSIIIRPAEVLKFGTRYIAAWRGVQHRDGYTIEPSPAFKELRDKLPTKDYGVKRRRALYEDIFAKLKAAGVAKEDLQLAWDFTTATKENTTGWMTSARDTALGIVGADGPAFTVKSVEENPSTGILRRIVVTMKVPHFMSYYARSYDNALFEQKGAPRLLLDEQGKPKINPDEPTMDQDVLILVPDSVADPTKKHGLLQNGHGLFGSMNEGRGGYLARIASTYGYIAFSTDLFGFANPDVSLAINALGARPQLFPTFFERQVQGMVNQLMAMRMMMGRVARDGIQDGSGNVLLAGSAIDPTLRAYRGDSQGGIMGTTYMAVSTDVTRGLLGEPGGPYSLLLNRSKDWPAYGVVLGASYASGLDNQLMLGLIQQGWDRSEPIGYVASLTDGSLAGGATHRVILHPAIGDHQVTTFSAHLLARAIGAVNMQASDGKVHRKVFGLEERQGPFTTESAMVEYEFGLAPEPEQNVPPKDGCDPHDRVRDLTPSYEQQDEFFRTGTISWHCNGVCNCDDKNPGGTEEDRCRETFQSQCN